MLFAPTTGESRVYTANSEKIGTIVAYTGRSRLITIQKSSCETKRSNENKEEPKDSERRAPDPMRQPTTTAKKKRVSREHSYHHGNIDRQTSRPVLSQMLLENFRKRKATTEDHRNAVHKSTSSCNRPLPTGQGGAEEAV